MNFKSLPSELRVISSIFRALHRPVHTFKYCSSEGVSFLEDFIFSSGIKESSEIPPMLKRPLSLFHTARMEAGLLLRQKPFHTILGEAHPRRSQLNRMQFPLNYQQTSFTSHKNCVFFQARKSTSRCLLKSQPTLHQIPPHSSQKFGAVVLKSFFKTLPHVLAKNSTTRGM